MRPWRGWQRKAWGLLGNPRMVWGACCRRGERGVQGGRHVKSWVRVRLKPPLLLR